MTPEQTLHSAIVRDPADDLAWMALADWLEEDGQTERAELLRLTRRLRGVPWDASERGTMEARVIELLLGGVEPANPEITNSFGLRLRLIPAGRFLMGAANDSSFHRDARPRHEVTLTRPLWVGVTPVTQKQYRAVMRTNPSHFRKSGEGKAAVAGMDADSFPVESMMWKEAVAFCKGASRRPREKGRKYRLPTEAEWEYACRGGALSTTRYALGNELTPSLAHYEASGLDRPCPVGMYPPNAFGLRDLHGQVWEWTADWFDEKYYARSPATDPPGPTVWGDRVTRGGAWNAPPFVCDTANRSCWGGMGTISTVGFRVVMTDR